MAVHLFKLRRIQLNLQAVGQKRGKGPPLLGFIPLPPGPRWTISGITKDSAGAALGGCDVQLFYTNTGALVGRTTSDGSGVFSFIVNGGGGGLYFAVAYKPGSPDVAGTTVNTLAGSPL